MVGERKQEVKDKNGEDMLIGSDSMNQLNYLLSYGKISSKMGRRG